GFTTRARESMARHVEAMVGFMDAGAEVFDYGASFAPQVAACAADDPVAADILHAAARHMADSAAAVCPADGTPEVGLTGGLFKMGEPLLGPVREELAERLPHARCVPAEGDPLRGAVRVATALATDTLTLPGDEKLLCVAPPE
ncbi:hypothetical protein AB0K93_36570, partial [Streptomyces sp. NPDC052676]